MKFYMVVLALDTTTRQGSAAVVRAGTLLGTFRGDPAVTHGERLPGDLVRLLDAHGLRVADVDVFAVAAGPGSFTGLRIGIATQQGLALANNRPLIGVSALDAINYAVRAEDEPDLEAALKSCAIDETAATDGPSATDKPASSDIRSVEVVAWIDAQRGQVFSARYHGDALLEGPLVDLPARILRDLPPDVPRVFAGDGAIVYESMIRASALSGRIVARVPLLAPGVAALAEDYLRRRGPMPPDALRPIYVRRSDAELARDRQTASAGTTSTT